MNEFLNEWIHRRVNKWMTESMNESFILLLPSIDISLHSSSSSSVHLLLDFRPPWAALALSAGVSRAENSPSYLRLHRLPHGDHDGLLQHERRLPQLPDSSHLQVMQTHPRHDRRHLNTGMETKSRNTKKWVVILCQTWCSNKTHCPHAVFAYADLVYGNIMMKTFSATILSFVMIIYNKVLILACSTHF